MNQARYIVWVKDCRQKTVGRLLGCYSGAAGASLITVNGDVWDCGFSINRCFFTVAVVMQAHQCTDLFTQASFVALSMTDSSTVFYIVVMVEKKEEVKWTRSDASDYVV